MATILEEKAALEKQLAAEQARAVKLESQIPKKALTIIDNLKFAVGNCQRMESEIKELKAEIARLGGKAKDTPAAATAVHAKPVKRDYNAEHDAIRNPRERALFRDAHKAELGLAPATM